jgi:hypothetical protein
VPVDTLSAEVSHDAAARGRRRRVYRVTLVGREALAVRRLEWKSFARSVESVLAGP